MNKKQERQIFKKVAMNIPHARFLLMNTEYDLDTMIDMFEVVHGNRSLRSAKIRRTKREVQQR